MDPREFFNAKPIVTLDCRRSAPGHTNNQAAHQEKRRATGHASTLTSRAPRNSGAPQSCAARGSICG
jgi:hypothetical protein